MSDLIRKAQDVMEEAAVEIERLDAENAKLRADALASEPIVKAQAGEIYRLRARLAASDAACAQMREALARSQSALREVGNDYPGSSCFTWCHARADEADAALSTDAGRNWIDASGAVESEVITAALANGTRVNARVPDSWAGKPVLIVPKPEGWK